MKRREKREKNVEEFVLRHMSLYKATPEEMVLAEARIQERLRSGRLETTEGLEQEFGTPRRSWKLKRLALVFGAAVAVALVVFLQIPQGFDARVVAESADGSLSRISGGGNEIIHRGDRIVVGEILRTNSAAAVTLADGSRVEARAQTEFSVERAEDGVQIHLRKGSLIIRAAKQVAGHLYVRTKDMVVSVVGTIFLVNAEEEGSRVAVIEGEVRVDQGTKTRNLLPGEQLATNPKLELLPVKEELSWSPEAEVHVAILAQTTPPPVQREAFVVESIRPSSPATVSPAVAGARAGGPAGCLRVSFQVSPGRFSAMCATVRNLVDLAYGIKNCPVAAREGPFGAILDQGIGRSTYVRSCVTGGPDWTKSDFYDVQATIPTGSPAYSRAELTAGNAPKLQAMLRTMLEGRFQLSVRREFREMPVYHLVVEKPGKIPLSDDQTPPGEIIPGATGPVSVRGGVANLPRGVLLNCAGNAIEIAKLAGCFQSETDRPIIDKTDLKGLYDIPARPADPAATRGAQLSTLPLTLNQLGLKLEPARAQLEVLVIERVERPSEN